MGFIFLSTFSFVLFTGLVCPLLSVSTNVSQLSFPFKAFRIGPQLMSRVFSKMLYRHALLQHYLFERSTELTILFFSLLSVISFKTHMCCI